MDKFEKLIKGIQEDLEMPEEIWDACLENIEQLPSRNIKKKNKKVIKYFVISAAAVLAMGTACYAMVKSGFLERLQREAGISAENADAYARSEIETEVKETEGEEIKFDYLWKISEAWCDGMMIYFEAEVPQEYLENDRLILEWRDHVKVNGNNCLLNVTGIVDEATGKENSKWMCSIDVSAIDSSGSMEVEIPLRLSRDDNKEPVFTGAGGELVIPTTVEYNEIMKNVKEIQTQTLRFTVEAEKKHRNIKPQVIALESGEVEIESGILAPSGMKLIFIYHAEEGAKLPGNHYAMYRVMDASGNVQDRIKSEEISDVYKDEQGRNCVRITMEMAMEALDMDTEAITVIPFGFDIDEDGKRIPGTEYELEGGRFTAELEYLE